MEGQSKERFKGKKDEGGDEKIGALRRKEGDGNEGTRGNEDRKT